MRAQGETIGSLELQMQRDQSKIRIRGLVSVICVALLAISVPAAGQAHEHTRQSGLELSSSDTHLVDAFNWAKQQAMAYVFDDDPVGPWYEASLPGRRAFCMRDVSHQAAGAQALGLSRYTHNMLRRFAENISASKDWCSYWEIDYRNLPAPVDYKSDKEFWYNLPANFDVLDTCYRMYLWTGDKSYVEDPVFLNFYDHSMTDYVARWDLSVNRIMARKNNANPPPFFRGDPSYEESRRDMSLGVDLLAAQYAGYRSFAAIQSLRGNKKDAEMYLSSASEVKSLVNSKWWNSSGGYFYSYLDGSRSFQGRAGADLLYWDVTDEGQKTQGALNAVLEDQRSQPASAVEPESHYAEILYRYGDPEAAYAEILDLSHTGRERREYPEVSYSVVGAIVNGLMGINVKPSEPIEQIVRDGRFETVVETFPQLTAKTTWTEVKNLPVQESLIAVREEENRRVVLSNQGKTVLTWRAAFPGSFATLLVNGKPREARSELRYPHRTVTWVNVPVQAGTSARVEIPK
jgi:hypothetical protein